MGMITMNNEVLLYITNTCGLLMSGVLREVFYVLRLMLTVLHSAIM